MADRLEQALQDHFGWNSFRPGQRPVVEAMLEGRDCLACCPRARANPSAISCRRWCAAGWCW
jgi:superfamily II DNA helicase RecQ